MSPSSGHSVSLRVLSKQQPTVPEKIRDTQTFYASIDRKLANDGDSTSIFNKLIGSELSHISSSNLYLRCQMNLGSNTIGTEAPNFVYLGLPAFNALDEVNIFGTPSTRIRRPEGGPHLSAPDHVLEKLQLL